MSMVKQTRIIFDPSDILQMRLRCGHCDGDASYPFNKRTLSVPNACPHCHEEWWENAPGVRLTDAEAHALNLVQAVHYFLNPRNADELDGLPFGIHLEIDGETDENA